MTIAIHYINNSYLVLKKINDEYLIEYQNKNLCIVDNNLLAFKVYKKFLEKSLINYVFNK